jgi:ketosteroid isomerase-like protein
MVYRAVVAAKVRQTWAQVNAGRTEAATNMAAPNIRFRFVGDTALGASLEGADAFREWFEEANRRLPGLHFEVVDVIVRGWPWDTHVAVRLDVSTTLADGSPYTNHVSQWVRLRWGRLVDDFVMEDTIALQRALNIQAEHQAEQQFKSAAQ